MENGIIMKVYVLQKGGKKNGNLLVKSNKSLSLQAK